MFTMAIKSEIEPTIKSILPFVKRVDSVGTIGYAVDVDTKLPWWSWLSGGLMKWHYKNRIESLIEMYGDRHTEYSVKVR